MTSFMELIRDERAALHIDWQIIHSPPPMHQGISNAGLLLTLGEDHKGFGGLPPDPRNLISYNIATPLQILYKLPPQVRLYSQTWTSAI